MGSPSLSFARTASILVALLSSLLPSLHAQQQPDSAPATTYPPVVATSRFDPLREGPLTIWASTSGYLDWNQIGPPLTQEFPRLQLNYRPFLPTNFTVRAFETARQDGGYPDVVYVDN
jgi:hypothetical protein